MMLRLSSIAIGLSIYLNLLASSATARMMFPGGFGAFGMSEWGANPAAGVMAGSGEFARGKGAYLIDKAKADAINVETMAKWNKALHARQAALREEKQKEAEKREAGRRRRVERIDLRDGITLNNLLSQIFDIDPTAVKLSRANQPISVSAIREIPFEADSEAVTLCLDHMTGKGSLPRPLMASTYVEEREALQAGGQVGPRRGLQRHRVDGGDRTSQRGGRQVPRQFLKNTPRLEAGYDDAAVLHDHGEPEPAAQ